jgi:phosphoglycolate phosphatase
MHIIFDFDGTIVDSLPMMIEKFNILSDQFNFRKIQLEDIPVLRNLSSQQLIKHLRIPIYKIPRILFQARKMMNADIPNLYPFENMYQLLYKLHQANITLGILTSNSTENVNLWLEINGMKQFFKFIHCGSHYFGKKRIINKIIKKYAIDKSHAYYIGDDTRDVDAAKKNAIYSIAVTWGFSSEEILIKHHPHYIARHPDDILRICGL